MKIGKTFAVVQGMVVMRRQCSAWMRTRDVGCSSRPMRNHVLMLILVCLSGLVSGCILPTRVGGYAVTGSVVDRCTGAPVRGATVFLRYTAVNFFGPRQVDSEPVRSDVLGKFYFPPKGVTMMGGSGGLAGETNKWPTVIFYKDGYSPRPGNYSPRRMVAISRASKAPIPQDYQAMVLELFKYGENCPVGSRLH
jgi:hypothetical protein